MEMHINTIPPKCNKCRYLSFCVHQVLQVLSYIIRARMSISKYFILCSILKIAVYHMYTCVRLGILISKKHTLRRSEMFTRQNVLSKQSILTSRSMQNGPRQIQYSYRWQRRSARGVFNIRSWPTTEVTKLRSIAGLAISIGRKIRRTARPRGLLFAPQLSH